LISRTGFATPGKPLVISMAILTIGLLLWNAIKNSTSWASLWPLPVVLAVGYVIGFFLVGQFVFRALLHDLYLINSFSGPSVLRVMLVLLLLYSLATILIAAASGKLYKRT
jgi:hypothetical protein